MDLKNFLNVIFSRCRNEENLKEDVSFERAYCLYRLNRTEEALAALGPASGDDFRNKELRGQILYRLEKYRESYNIYRYDVNSLNVPTILPVVFVKLINMNTFLLGIW